MPAAKKKPGKRRSSRSRLPAGLRKARVDSVLKNLPDEAQEQLWTLLNTRHTTEKQVLALATQLAGRTISHHQLNDWRPWHAAKTHHARVIAQVDSWKLLSEAQMDHLRQHGTAVFMSLGISREDPDTFFTAGRLQLAGREMSAKEEALRLAVEKFEEQKQKLAKTLKNARKRGGLTAETKQEIEEALSLL